MDDIEFKQLFLKTVNNKENPFHPLVWITDEPLKDQTCRLKGLMAILF